MAVFTVLSTGDALAEMPPLNSRALGDLLIQRGGIADGHAAAEKSADEALGVILIQRNEEAAEDTDSITPSPAEENIIFAETKVDDDAFVTSNELVQSSSNELAALKSRLDVQVAKAKKKMKAGKGTKGCAAQEESEEEESEESREEEEEKLTQTSYIESEGEDGVQGPDLRSIEQGEEELQAPGEERTGS